VESKKLKKNNMDIRKNAIGEYCLGDSDNVVYDSRGLTMFGYYYMVSELGKLELLNADG
jgi:hypothetical protein